MSAADLISSGLMPVSRISAIKRHPRQPADVFPQPFELQSIQRRTVQRFHFLMPKHWIRGDNMACLYWYATLIIIFFEGNNMD